jgi:hypothetical protein
MDPVPDPLLLRKCGRAGNRTRDLWVCNQKLLLLDHGGGLLRLKGFSKLKEFNYVIGIERATFGLVS